VDGVLNIRKASGPTSHDVVDQVRRIFGQKRVGHAGTLDPMASGVLVVCLGKATRVVEYLMGLPKEYRARMVLGISTDTQDSTGTVISERDASGISREAFENAAAAFVGEIEQVPPMTSALKHEGTRLYKLARQGKTVDRPARKITIYSIDVTEFSSGPIPNSQFPIPDSESPTPNSQLPTPNWAELVVRSSSGTYIRTLCSDIGDRLGCGAHMSALERTRVGQFAIEGSVTIEELESATRDGRLDSLAMTMDDALAGLPSVAIAGEDVARASNGMAVPCSEAHSEADTVRILSPEGVLVGIGEVLDRSAGRIVKPRKVLIGDPTPNSQPPAPDPRPPTPGAFP